MQVLIELTKHLEMWEYLSEYWKVAFEYICIAWLVYVYFVALTPSFACRISCLALVQIKQYSST